MNRVTTDAKRLGVAEWFMRDADIPLLKEVEPAFDPNGGPDIVLRAKSLAAYMALSAASALERRVDMRRCTHCGSWLELTRREALFCSSSCRAFHSQQRAGK